jgi:hypothetical protein
MGRVLIILAVCLLPVNGLAFQPVIAGFMSSDTNNKNTINGFSSIASGGATTTGVDTDPKRAGGTVSVYLECTGPSTAEYIQLIIDGSSVNTQFCNGIPHYRTATYVLPAETSTVEVRFTGTTATYLANSFIVPIP